MTGAPSSRLVALGAGIALGAAAALAVGLWGRPEQADLGGLCLAPSPLGALAASGRPCERLALNLVTLPALTGAALLLPGLPGRLAVRVAHGLAAAAPAAVVAVVVAGRGSAEPSLLLPLAVLAGALLTGVLHLGSRRRGVTVAHLALAGAWLALAVGADLAATLAR